MTIIDIQGACQLQGMVLIDVELEPCLENPHGAFKHMLLLTQSSWYSTKLFLCHRHETQEN